MKVAEDMGQIAFCGLYCPACDKYLKNSCPGCKENTKATWCKVRTCCIDKKILSCADCDEFETANECKKFNNFFSKVFGYIFNSDRHACIEMIKEKGYEDYAMVMAKDKKRTQVRR